MTGLNSSVGVLDQGHVNFVEGLDVVFAVRVVRVHAKDVFGGDPAHVLLAENAILAGIAGVPGELLGDDLDDRRFALFGELIHRLGPERDGQR